MPFMKVRKKVLSLKARIRNKLRIDDFINFKLFLMPYFDCKESHLLEKKHKTKILLEDTKSSPYKSTMHFS